MKNNIKKYAQWHSITIFGSDFDIAGHKSMNFPLKKNINENRNIPFAHRFSSDCCAFQIVSIGDRGLVATLRAESHHTGGHNNNNKIHVRKVELEFIRQQMCNFEF